MSTTTSPNIIFGAGGIGHTAKSFTFTWETPEAVSELLEKLKSLHVFELDSAASYPPSNPWHTETLLGQAQAVEKGFIVDSKVLKPGALNDQNITFSVNETLRLLGTSRIRTLYAHEPDPTTPLEETAAALHKQFLAGKFEKVENKSISRCFASH
jgi:aflatoxin B1 aldehyde reductase